MSRIAVVGCEASGKTVFMSALTDHYRRADAIGGCVLVPENATANKFAAYLHRSMRQMRQWPAATNPDETRRMAWTLRRGGDTLAEIEMLEFGGETFRAAFSEESPPESRRKAVDELLDYLKGADFIVALVSLAHVFQEPSSLDASAFDRAVEAEWATRELLNFIRNELPSSTRIVIGLTQADRFAARLASSGGPAEALANYWPGVRAAAPDVPVLPVASVSATDSDGLPIEGYNTDGILPVMREFSRHVFGSPSAIETGEFPTVAPAAPAAAPSAAETPPPVKGNEGGGAKPARASGAIKALLLLLFAVALAFAAHEAFKMYKGRSAPSSPADTPDRPSSKVVGPLPAVASSNRPSSKAASPQAAVNVQTTNQLSQATNQVDAAAEKKKRQEAELAAAHKRLAENLAAAVAALDAEDAEKAHKLLDAVSLSSLLTPEQSKRLASAKEFCALLEHAFDGDVKAQTALAEAYYGGRGFAKRNHPRAHLWYTIAANSGGGKAQLALAVMYDEGQGVKPNPAEASVWFRKAAESGEPDAMYRVGIECYKTGGKAEANSWFRRAKDAGSKIENIDKWIKVTDSSADNTGGKTSVTPTHDSKAARQEWRKAGEEFTINEPYGLNLTMKWCPAGTFTMGSPESEEGRNNDEREHRVTLSKGFWMGETEVTQGQWKKIMDGETVVDLSRKALLDDNEYFIAGKKQTLRAALNKQKYDYDKVFGGNDKDVIDQIAIYWVSWYDAVKFCNRLTQSERKLGYLPDGYEYRLPTEAEWEYSCRANTTSALPNGTGLHMIDMGNATALDSIAWYRGNSTLKKVSKDDIGRSVQIIESSEKSLFLSPQEVKGKQPNAWGLYDMIGNLLEWCGDWYGEYPYGLATDTTGAERGADRVLRGGSWIDFARLCRSAARRMGEPGFRSPNLGFRVALAPKLPEEYRKAVQAELQKANVVIRHEQYPTPGTKRESEQEGKAVNLKNERVKAMDNSIFYDRNKKFDEHKAFDAYKSMCSNFGYPFENVVNVANKQGLGFGFWSVDYMKGAFANCGLGGIVRENDIKEEKSEIEYFLLPGQSQVEYRMLPTHAKIKHHKTGQFFEKDLPAKKSRWLVKHGWVYYFSSVGTANLDSYPEIKASISSVFRSVLKSVHVERWDADGQIHEVEGVSHWQFLMGGDEGAVVIEYGNYHDGSGFRFSVSGVGF